MNRTVAGTFSPFYVPSFITLLGAAAFLLVDHAAFRTWNPWMDGNVPVPIVSMHFRMPHAAETWRLMVWVITIWSALYVVAVLKLKSIASKSTREQVAAYAIAATQALTLLAFTFAPLPVDGDQNAYVGYADLVSMHQNPYHLPPNDPAFRALELHWVDPFVVDRYGPAFTTGIAVVLYPFSRDRVETQARILRWLAALAAVSVSFLIWLIASNDWRLVASAAFALNPLILVEVGVNGHNDIYLVLFALGAYLLAARGRFLQSAVTLAIATAIKFSPGAFALVLGSATYYRTRSISNVCLVFLAFVITLLIFALPFGVTASLIHPLMYIRTNEARYTPTAYYLFRAIEHLTHVNSLSIHPFLNILPATFAIAILVISWLALQGRRNFALETSALSAALLSADKIEPWYAIILSALLVLPSNYALATFLAGTLAAQFLMEYQFDGDFNYPRFYVLFLLLTIGFWLLLALQRQRLTRRAESKGV